MLGLMIQNFLCPAQKQKGGKKPLMDQEELKKGHAYMSPYSDLAMCYITVQRHTTAM